MSGRFARALGPATLAALVLATGAAAAASAAVEQASGNVLTLVGIGFLLWVVGSILSHHRYSSGGPKGEKLPPAQ